MLAVIDCRAPQSVCRALREQNFEILPLPPHPALQKPVASHPDMLLFFASDRIFCTKSYLAIAKNELTRLSDVIRRPIQAIESELSESYPHDVLLNAAAVGNHLIAHPRAIARELQMHPSYSLVPTKQGYSKCSVVSVSQNAIITSDPSIEEAAKQAGIDVLRVSPAPIALKGYDSGFLGGATSCSPYRDVDFIFFCGDWRTHPDAEAIEDFCKKHHKTPIALGDEPLADLGTVFLLFE